jgi:hypothetical protein
LTDNPKKDRAGGGARSPARKPWKALAVGGFVLAGAFVATAIFSPESLDWILRPGEGTSDQIKREMERQKGSDPDGRSDATPGPGEETKSGATTPTPSPEGTVNAACISRDQVVNIIGASEEAREGRVIWISGTPDGHRITVAYRKKTFLGIGSGENQIEGILRRGLRDRFPERLIKSVKVRSGGKRSVRQGSQYVKAEVLEIETLQPGCRWP